MVRELHHDEGKAGRRYRFTRNILLTVAAAVLFILGAHWTLWCVLFPRPLFHEWGGGDRPFNHYPIDYKDKSGNVVYFDSDLNDILVIITGELDFPRVSVWGTSTSAHFSLDSGERIEVEKCKNELIVIRPGRFKQRFALQKNIARVMQSRFGERGRLRPAGESLFDEVIANLPPDTADEIREFLETQPAVPVQRTSHPLEGGCENR